MRFDTPSAGGLYRLITVLCLLFAACNPATEELGTGDDDDVGGTPDVSWVLRPNSANPFGAIAEIQSTASDESTVWIEYGTDGRFDQSTPEYSLADSHQLTLQVLGLRADSTYSLRLAIDDGSEVQRSEPEQFSTAPLLAQFPPCEVSTDADVSTFDDQEIFCTNAGPSAQELPFVFCVDRTGSPVWMLRHPDDEIMNNFLPLTDGGFAGTGRSSDFTALFDRFGQLSQQFASVWFHEPGMARFDHHWINEHELIEILEGPWVGKHAVLTITADEVDGINHMASGILVFEPDTGVVAWDWMAHGELGDGVPIDPKLIYHRHGLLEEGEFWMFGNALAHEIVDGHPYFWLSARNQDWILKIDVEDDSVVWRFGYEGDFTLVDDLDSPHPEELEPSLWQFHQHAPEIIERNGSRVRFMLFDNGVVRPDLDGQIIDEPPYSRVVEFELDEQSMLATIRFEYGAKQPDPDHFFSHIYGNAAVLPGNDSFLYTNGDGADGPYFAEVSYPQGEELWRFTCPGRYFYRALHFDDIYAMTW